MVAVKATKPEPSDNQTLASKEPRAVLRYALECIALVRAEGSRPDVACEFRTKSHPKQRKAEIELQSHALTHARLVVKKVIVERREVEVAL